MLVATSMSLWVNFSALFHPIFRSFTIRNYEILLCLQRSGGVMRASSSGARFRQQISNRLHVWSQYAKVNFGHFVGVRSRAYQSKTSCVPSTRSCALKRPNLALLVYTTFSFVSGARKHTMIHSGVIATADDVGPKVGVDLMMRNRQEVERRRLGLDSALDNRETQSFKN